MPIVCQRPGLSESASLDQPTRFSPMKRKTAFSSRKWTVRQFSRSAIRAWADWMPATGSRGTARRSRPRARPSRASELRRDERDDTGVTSERLVSSTERRQLLADREHRADRDRIRPPTPTTTASTKSPTTAGIHDCDDRERRAALSATSAVASLSRLSPSSTVTIRRGSAQRPATAVTATASVGATTAPKARAAARPDRGHERPGDEADRDHREDDQPDREQQDAVVAGADVDAPRCGSPPRRAAAAGSRRAPGRGRARCAARPGRTRPAARRGPARWAPTTRRAGEPGDRDGHDHERDDPDHGDASVERRARGGERERRERHQCSRDSQSAGTRPAGPGAGWSIGMAHRRGELAARRRMSHPGSPRTSPPPARSSG